MSPENRAFTANRAKRGTFEMAKANPDRYESTACYLVGAIAVHRSAGCASYWSMSHAATGLLLSPFWSTTLAGAVRIAVDVDAAIDWSSVKRGRGIGIPTGWTKAKRGVVVAMDRSFRPIAARASR